MYYFLLSLFFVYPLLYVKLLKCIKQKASIKSINFFFFYQK